MTELEQEESTMLARARAGLSPARDDVERVRGSLAIALAAPAALLPPPPRAGLWARLGSHLVVATAVAAAAGATGYWAGKRAGERPAPAVAPAPRTALTPAVSPLAPEVPGIPTVPAAPLSRQPRPGRAAAHPAPAAPSLDEELRALRGVERALRDGEPGMALALLRELDRTIPEGRLSEEREATASIARCALGQVPFGIDPAREFAARHPGSVYFKRVEQACAGRVKADDETEGSR